MVKAKRLVQQGGWTILACAVDVRGKEKNLENMSIVNEFPNVHLDDLPRIPPSRAVDFIIELEPGTGSISKAPYRMALADLKELKVQLQDLRVKGSFDLAYSPGVCQCCLFRRKMD